METALHSTTKTFLKVMEDKPPVEQEEEKDKLISSLHLHPGWDAMSEYLDTMIEQLDNLEGVIEPTDTPEEIGFRFMISRVTKSYLETVRDLPEALSNVREND